MARYNQTVKRWKDLPAESKDAYVARAAAENRVVEEVRGMDFHQFSRSNLAQSLRRGLKLSLRRSSVIATLRKLSDHAAWETGASVDCFEGGLHVDK
eukprot:8730089-Pyramimonas_sp.AAC.1